MGRSGHSNVDMILPFQGWQNLWKHPLHREKCVLLSLDIHFLSLSSHSCPPGVWVNTATLTNSGEKYINVKSKSKYSIIDQSFFLVGDEIEIEVVSYFNIFHKIWNDILTSKIKVKNKVVYI